MRFKSRQPECLKHGPSNGSDSATSIRTGPIPSKPSATSRTTGRKDHTSVHGNKHILHTHTNSPFSPLTDISLMRCHEDSSCLLTDRIPVNIAAHTRCNGNGLYCHSWEGPSFLIPVRASSEGRVIRPSAYVECLAIEVGLPLDLPAVVLNMPLVESHSHGSFNVPSSCKC